MERKRLRCRIRVSLLEGYDDFASSGVDGHRYHAGLGWMQDDVHLQRLVEADADHREFDGGRVRLCVREATWDYPDVMGLGETGAGPEA